MYVSFNQFAEQNSLWAHWKDDGSRVYPVLEGFQPRVNGNIIKKIFDKKDEPERIYVQVEGRKDEMSFERDAIHNWQMWELKRVY